VAGEATTTGGEAHAFLYTDGVMIDLGTLGGSWSQSVALNAAGQVAGNGATANDGETHAFLYTDGVMIDLGTLGGPTSTAQAINGAGDVVGFSDAPDGTRAFVYTQGQLLDLNTLIPADSGWRLDYATGINDSGQIIGSGIVDGASHAFLLTPVETAVAQVQPPINTDGSSIFNARRGVVPVRFTLALNGQPTCQLPPATIRVTRTAGGATGAVDESVYLAAADSGSNFRIDDCQYVYNLAASSLGTGTYRVEIVIDGRVAGHAEFTLR